MKRKSHLSFHCLVRFAYKWSSDKGSNMFVLWSGNWHKSPLCWLGWLLHCADRRGGRQEEHGWDREEAQWDVNQASGMENFTIRLGPLHSYFHYILHSLQCVPLYTMLAALGHPTVNWFILDIEGAEFQVLREKPKS